MTLPQGWEARTDPQSGRTYYQNNLTTATQWEPPLASAPPLPPLPPLPNAGYPGNPGAGAGADYLLKGLQATNRSRCWWQLVFGIVFLILWLTELTVFIAELFAYQELVDNECEKHETSSEEEECVHKMWEVWNTGIGFLAASIALGLFFATCAVSSSILYNICNCYERPAAPKLLTIARLSNIAFIGHACVSLLIYVPLGLVIFSLVLQGGDSDPHGLQAVLLAVAIFLGLIASIYPCSAYVFRRASAGIKEEHTARTSMMISIPASHFV